jgi:protein phosphatase
MGRVRKNNEDSFLVDRESRLVVVCDGMGGHSKGEVASALAIETLQRVMKPGAGTVLNAARPPDSALLPEAGGVAAAVRLAAARIYSVAASEPDHRGMGTTVVVTEFTSDGTVVTANVGDSRAYRFRDGQLSQLTRDHTFLNELLEDKEISADEARTFKQKNVLSRALGTSPAVKVDVRVDAALTGDVYLLCSDGLHGVLDDETMAGLIEANKADLSQMAQTLIDEANARGGPDNITVVLAAVDESPQTAPGQPLKVELPDDEGEFPKRQRALAGVFDLPRRSQRKLPLVVGAVVAVAVAAVLTVILVAGIHPRRPAARFGSLHVKITPEAAARVAEVRLGGMVLRSLSAESLRLDSSYRVVVTAPGYLPYDGTVSVESSGRVLAVQLLPGATLELAFQSVEGMVEFTARDGETEVIHRMVSSDSLPYKDRIVAGRYTFRVRWAGGKTLERRATVAVGDRVAITPDLNYFEVITDGRKP